MSDPLGRYSYYRLDFEQQGKRAKDLLKAARKGDAAAVSRFDRQHVGRPHSVLKLADAQLTIARELRFKTWAAMKHHIARMSHEREAATVLDAERPTLHIRCGSDLKESLRAAGFRGDYHEHSYAYLIGPVHDDGPGVLEERARFIVDAYSGDKEPPLDYTGVLAGLQSDERTLLESARYGRVVIWSEFDCYDQLVLIRLLAHYARHERPSRIELVNCGDFPGGMRFIGLGHLPPEALRLLWARRQVAGTAQLSLGAAAWRALADGDPRALAALMRTGTPALPLLAPALHRHLRELPSVENGLSLTEHMALQLLAEGPHSLERIFGRLTHEIDPLPGQGDLQVRDRVLGMEVDAGRVFIRTPGTDGRGRARPPWTDVLTISDLGRRVLAGEVDFRSLNPPPRWVGGVRIAPGMPDWRWHEACRDACLR